MSASTCFAHQESGLAYLTPGFLGFPSITGTSFPFLLCRIPTGGCSTTRRAVSERFVHGARQAGSNGFDDCRLVTRTCLREDLAALCIGLAEAAAKVQCSHVSPRRDALRRSAD